MPLTSGPVSVPQALSTVGAVSIPEQPGPQAADSEESTATSIEGYLDAVCAETLDALDRFERMGAGA